MPCVEWFAGQDMSYQEEVLPPGIRARVSVEAGIALGWRAFVGDAGGCVSPEHFGASAAHTTLYEEYGSRRTGWRCRPVKPDPAEHRTGRLSAALTSKTH
jgi:transketolase